MFKQCRYREEKGKKARLMEEQMRREWKEREQRSREENGQEERRCTKVSQVNLSCWSSVMDCNGLVNVKSLCSV